MVGRQHASGTRAGQALHIMEARERAHPCPVTHLLSAETTCESRRGRPLNLQRRLTMSFEDLRPGLKGHTHDHRG